MQGHARVDLDVEGLWGLTFEAAGAATAPLMRDHPDYVFPSEEVSEGVRNVLHRHGFTDPPEGYTLRDRPAPVPVVATAKDAEALRQSILDALDSEVGVSSIDRDDFDAKLVTILGLAVAA
jgi:hypothetical protein